MTNHSKNVLFSPNQDFKSTPIVFAFNEKVHRPVDSASGITSSHQHKVIKAERQAKLRINR